MSEYYSKNPMPIVSPPASQVEPLDRYSVLIVRGAIVGSGLLGLALFVRNSRMFATYRNVKLIPSDFYELGIQMKGIVREVAPNGLLRVEHQPAVRLPRMFSRRFFHTSSNMSQTLSEDFVERMINQKDETMEKLREKMTKEKEEFMEKMTKKLMEESEKVGRLRSDLVHKTEEFLRTAGLLNARELIDLFDGMCYDLLKNGKIVLERPLTQDDEKLLIKFERKDLARRVLLYHQKNVRGFGKHFDTVYGKAIIKDLGLLQAMLGTLYKMRNLEAHPSVIKDREIEVVLPKESFSASEQTLVKAMLESMFESIKPKGVETIDK